MNLTFLICIRFTNFDHEIYVLFRAENEYANRISMTKNIYVFKNLLVRCLRLPAVTKQPPPTRYDPPSYLIYSPCQGPWSESGMASVRYIAGSEASKW